MVYVFFFFFQAEDGIRDLVRSRGLGDVYKRQEPSGVFGGNNVGLLDQLPQPQAGVSGVSDRSTGPVSYTHLTLPTSDLV